MKFLRMLILSTCLFANPVSAETKEASASAKEITAEQAAQVYSWFKGLEGTWRGKSTKGWEEEVTIQTIAAESSVVFRSFEAHPGEQMLTLIHPDGDRLLLTHYCVAKNQPHLQATSVDIEARTVTFTFLSATNISSRDEGHMDQVIYDFGGADSFTSRWTWYEKGNEQWLEKIEYSRGGGKV